MVEPKIMKWTCPECGKTIYSLSERQLEALKRTHEIKHTLK